MLTLLSLGGPTIAQTAGTSCGAPGTTLIAEAEGSLVAVDPVTGEIGALPDPGEAAGRSWTARRIADLSGPPRWTVVRTAEDAGTHIVVTDARTGAVVLDERFGQRIELAASAVSPNGRFSVYVQGNNIATEVTILDALQSSTRFVRIAHDADLAPYAIGIVFGPVAVCAALSMERIGGPGPETWLVDLETGGVSRLGAPGVFVVDWLPFQVD